MYQRQSSIIICSYLWKSLPPSSNVILHILQWVNNIYKNHWSRVICFEIFAPMKFHWNAHKIAYFTNLMLCPSPCVSLHTPSSSTFCNITELVATHNSRIWCGKVTRESYNAKVPKGRESSKCVPKTKFNHWFAPTCESHYHPVQMLFCIVLQWVNNIYKNHWSRVICFEILCTYEVSLKCTQNCILYQLDVVPLALC